MSIEDRTKEIINYMSSVPDYYPSLSMTIASSTLNFENRSYKINPNGLANSPREANDGIVLFGTKNNKNVIHDFTFPIEFSTENSMMKNAEENIDAFPNFAIYFNLEDKAYYIKDFNTGLGALMKAKEYVLKENTLINVGSNYLVISFEEPELIVKIFNSSILQDKKEDLNTDKFQMKKFKIDDINFKITIGRSQTCDISIDDMMLSKVQCRIEYDNKMQCFVLFDGDGSKESTNGTWIYILHPAKIENNFLFKAEHTLFHIAFIDKH